jgi:type IV secretion system protein VirB11
VKTPQEVQAERFLAMLKRELGPDLLAVLDDPAVTDVMRNADGSIWIAAHGRGMYRADFTMADSQVEALIGTLAAALGAVADAEHPIVEGELPIRRVRFEGLRPPIVKAPAFALRKPAQVLYTLADNVQAGIIKPAWADFLSEAVARKLNIVIAGVTGSGKTTFAGALLNEMVERSDPSDRYVILEDLPEIQCKAGNALFLLTSETVDLTRLVRTAMRLYPTRIIIGETRGAECLALLKAWLTHSGGVTTVHATSVKAALMRLGSLIQEAAIGPQPELIAETVNLIAVIEASREGRRVTELARVECYSQEKGFIVSPV